MKKRLGPRCATTPLARAMASLGKGMSRVDHEAFAHVAASQIDKECLVEDEANENIVIQWWDSVRKVWVKAGGGRRLGVKVVDVCRKTARPVDSSGVRELAPTRYGNSLFHTDLLHREVLPARGS